MLDLQMGGMLLQSTLPNTPASPAPLLPLLQKQAAAQEQLGALPPPRELVAAQQELAARISGLESDLQLLQVARALHTVILQYVFPTMGDPEL